MRKILLTCALLALPCAAQAAGSLSPSVNGGRNDGQAIHAFKADNDKMMHDMDVHMTGDPDRDFTALMIPHHRGAVDMAKTELQYGKDAQLRAMAQKIIDSQTTEIGDMKKWQDGHPGK